MGLTVVDAGVLIGLLDADDDHHLAAAASLRAALDRRDRLVLPTSAYAEARVGPARRGPGAIEHLEEALTLIPLHLQPLDAEVAGVVAAIRAGHHRVKLPDAIVIATAGALGATHLITTDRGWPPVEDLGLVASVEVLGASGAGRGSRRSR